ncbi:DNA ligase D [Peribacillus sp. FSL H8-0477]|uniref:DNA ligase D n=1 Tax=Peribacillus sp. FSL H8-0477 TaxID=2921388 RepID=UPI0030FA5587
MLPTYREDAPKGTDWLFEPKYDGFRAILTLSNHHISLISRNGKELLPQFPEIEAFVNSIIPTIEKELPLVFDGELVWLENPYKSNFMHMQWRGRLRNAELISKAVTLSPCTLLAFDLLQIKGKSIMDLPYVKRKSLLFGLGQKQKLPLVPEPKHDARIQLVPNNKTFDFIKEQVLLHDGEGIVAKNAQSSWQEGKRTENWYKLKNWRTVTCFITALDKENEYLTCGVYKDDEIVKIGQVKNGIKPTEKEIIRTLVKNNAHSEDDRYYFMDPSLCISVHFLHAYDQDHLREPQFDRFVLDQVPQNCTWEAFTAAQYTFPETVTVTSPDKPIWELPTQIVTKVDYLQYLRITSSRFLPYLQNRSLTSIRYPHGVLGGERFFQKNVPEYAPDFVKTVLESDHEAILCNDLQTLLWLGNQLAIEFHTPFQKSGKIMPEELILDLDPPGHDHFHLAIKAALIIKGTLDTLNISAFVKTSGNRGLQVHIPLPADVFSYNDTRMFTEFLGDYITGAYPDDFTTERMIKKRGTRLYLDFVQHHEGKTLIAPYSPRGNDFAGVATPLYWDELQDDIQITDYTILTVPERIRKLGCPFAEMEKVRSHQPFGEVLAFLKQNGLRPPEN